MFNVFLCWTSEILLRSLLRIDMIW